MTSPVFIVGCARTGTTWLWQMLCAHSNAERITAANWSVKDGTESGCLMAKLPYRDEDVVRVFRDICAAGKVPVEKTPWHVYCLPKLFRLFPDAKVLMMRRDPRAVAASWKRFWPDRTVEFAFSNWIAANEAARPFADRLYDVAYEDLHTAPVATLSGALEHCGLDPDEATRILDLEHTENLDIGTIDSWKDHLTPEELRSMEHIPQNHVRAIERLVARAAAA